MSVFKSIADGSLMAQFCPRKGYRLSPEQRSPSLFHFLRAVPNFRPRITSALLTTSLLIMLFPARKTLIALLTLAVASTVCAIPVPIWEQDLSKPALVSR